MTAENEQKLEDRIKQLEQEIEDSKHDRELIKSLIRKIIDMIATTEGRQRKALEAIRDMLKGDYMGDEG